MLPLSSLLHFYGFQAAGGRPGREMFGTRWMAILFGIAFIMRQVGSSLGAQVLKAPRQVVKIS
jgi:hypothetical protein